MLLIFLLFIITCGVLVSNDGFDEDFTLSEEDRENYEDLLDDPENRYLLEFLFGYDYHYHLKATAEEIERATVFRGVIKGRSDFIAEILRRESVNVSHDISRSEWDRISRATSILNFIMFIPINKRELILEEIRLRIIPWEDITFDHTSRHYGYLASMLGFLILYGDSSDLERLERFKEHPDGFIRHKASSAQTQLEKRLSEEPPPNKRGFKRPMLRDRKKRSDGLPEVEEELDGNPINSENLWGRWIFGILFAGAGGIWFYKRRT